MSKRIALGLFALALLAPGCGQSTTPSDIDSGLPPIDAAESDGSVLPDGGTPDDTGLPPVDMGTPELDSGPEPIDGGTDAAVVVESCASPGATESVPCGMCGTVNRFCTAAMTWAYGACTGETGVCMPGAMSSIPCGHCGTQPANCDLTCHWVGAATCSGEGECAPGDRTRTGTGCPSGQTHDLLCDSACTYQSAGACAADGCPTPGATENTACGMCGTVSRFCDASHIWQYGTCTGEGGCMPGTTGSQSCGMCGTQVTHCDATCHNVAFGSCMSEGVCTPGATTITAMGCPPGQMHQMRCDTSCGYTVEVTPCASSRPVDVTFVLDVTGSNNAALGAAITPLQNDCIAPLLALTGVQVGVSFMAEFPNPTYGTIGDRPFQGGIEPTTVYANLTSVIAARPVMNGNDAYDATIPAISMLVGGGIENSSLPLTCSAGRTAGGCWRTGAARVIVIHTDSPMHGGPLATGAGVDSPYAGIAPVPAQWPAVQTAMTAQGVTLVWLDATQFDSTSTTQMSRMVADLGQPSANRHATTTAGAVTTACGQIVAQVRALAGL